MHDAPRRASTSVIALIGIPGAGKSRLAQALAARLGWPIVDRDSFPRARFDEACKVAATDAAFEEVARHLANGGSCILDGMTFAAAAQRARLRELARAHQARSILLWLDCAPEVALARVGGQRDHPARDRDAALVREVVARFERPESDVARLDALLPTEALVDAALAAISPPGT